MGTREELASGTREELAAELAQAEADLARVVDGCAWADAGAEARLEKARAHCRQARAALAGSDFVRPSQPSEPPVAAVEKPHRERAGLRKAIQGPISGFSARGPAPSWRLLARQALTLLALVVAYLQYYFLDVHLQVSRLPSISTLLTRLG